MHNPKAAATQRTGGASLARAILAPTLLLFTPGSGNTELALTYASYGGYLLANEGNGRSDVDSAFFTFGVRTAATNLPRTGSATYQCKIDGQFTTSNEIYILAGPSSFAADFAANTIAFSMTPIGIPQLGTASRSFGTISMKGTIASTGEFSGTGTGTYQSALTGYFYGPAAAEFGGSFTLSGAGGSGAGIVVGKKN